MLARFLTTDLKPTSLISLIDLWQAVFCLCFVLLVFVFAFYLIFQLVGNPGEKKAVTYLTV